LIPSHISHNIDEEGEPIPMACPVCREQKGWIPLFASSDGAGSEASSTDVHIDEPLTDEQQAADVRRLLADTRMALMAMQSERGSVVEQAADLEAELRLDIADLREEQRLDLASMRMDVQELEERLHNRQCVIAALDRNAAEADHRSRIFNQRVDRLTKCLSILCWSLLLKCASENDMMRDSLEEATADVELARSEEARARLDGERSEARYLAAADAQHRAYVKLNNEHKALQAKMKSLNAAGRADEEHLSPPTKRKRETRGGVPEVRKATARVEDDFAFLDVVNAPRPASRDCAPKLATPRAPLTAKINAFSQLALGPKHRKRVS
jgi:chromosome segregation ATPase